MEIEHKKDKAKKYMQELERFSLEELKVEIHSEHGERIVTYTKEKGFLCTCDYIKP